VDFANRKYYGRKIKQSWGEPSCGQWGSNANVKYGVTGIIIETIKRTIHQGWWLCRLDSTCSKGRRPNNQTIYKQTY
jgi:hypothetical protein